MFTCVAESVFGCHTLAQEDRVGPVQDLFFVSSDEGWRVQYLVVDTGAWLHGRLSLLPPKAIHRSNWAGRELGILPSREEIELSPPPDQPNGDEPFVCCYSWPACTCNGVASPLDVAGVTALPGKDEGHVLRSAREVIGYHIEAKDGEIGHIVDFVLDDGPWSIEYLVIDTRNWIPGKRVLVPTNACRQVSLTNQRISIGLNRESVRNSPELDPKDQPRGSEHLYEYYGRPRNWAHH